MNESLKPNHLTIVVNTCDAYCDVLEIFFHALREYWPNCPYSLIINTESLTYNHNIQVHHHSSPSGGDDWGMRLCATLSSIESPYVMMLYDDFILNAPVSNEFVQQTLNLLNEQSTAAVAYLIDTKLPLSRIPSHSMFVPIKDRVDYRLNSAPAIWRRQHLMNYTKAGDTPWAWEVFGTYRTWGDGQVFYSIKPKHPDIYSYNHVKGGAIYRGKWVREVVEEVAKKYPLDIDWNIRGFSSDGVFEKRSFSWKLRFIQIGFRMVGLKALYFAIYYVRKRLHVY